MGKLWNLESAIYSTLRRLHRHSPEYSRCLALAKSDYFVQAKNGNMLRRVQFECAQCHNKFPRTGVSVDHIEPVVAVTGKTTFDEYIKRLFCSQSGLQILCQATCHRIKSNTENAQRRIHKKEKA